MELSQEEEDLFKKKKSECETKISEHIKEKEEYIKQGDYEKAKIENQIVENLMKRLEGLELKKMKTLKDKQISKLNFNYEELIKQTKDEYEIKLRTAELKYDENLQKLKNKRKQMLKDVEIKYAYQKKYSPEYKAMEEEEIKLLQMNRFDEAIALQKLRKKKEEEDDIRYRMIHRNEMESLKKNVDINYNKEFTNLQNRKNNEIEMIKKEMNIALDNIDKRFNKRRHDLIILEASRNSLTNKISLTKSRIFSASKITNMKRIFNPIPMSEKNKNKIPTQKPKNKKTRMQSAQTKK